MLPKDILQFISLFLDVKSFIAFTNTSQTIFLLNNYESFWKNCCKTLWKGKASMHYSYNGASEGLFNGLRLSESRTEQLTIKEMKLIIRSFNINPQSLCFFEKAEYLEKVKTLLCHNEREEENFETKKFYFQSLWKTSYVQSLVDSKRTRILKSELTSLLWSAFLKLETEMQTYVGVSEKTRNRAPFTSGIEFKSNNRISVNFAAFGQGNIEYQYEILYREDKTFVNVINYPCFYVYRDPYNWRWVMESERVILRSEHYACD